MSKEVSNFKIMGEVIDIKDNEARSSIITLNNEVSKIQHDSYLTELVVLGDSFGKGYKSGGGYVTYNMGTILGSLLHLNVHNYSNDGAGYTVTGNTFLMQAEAAIADTSFDHANVKYVIVIGGVNDVLNSALKDQIHSYAETLFSTIAGEFTNCKIVLAPCWNSCRIPDVEEIVFRNFCNIDEAGGCAVVALYDNLKCMMGYTNYFGDDNLHPTQEGYYMLASNVAAMLNGGYIARGYNVSFTEEGAWDCSNLHIYRNEDGIRIFGYAEAKETITLSNNVVCTLNSGFTIPGTPFILAQVLTASGYHPASVLVNPTFDVKTGGLTGDITMMYDYGQTINTGERLILEGYYPLLNY